MPGNMRYGGQSAHPPPTRAMSLDSLHDKNASLDLKVREYLPSRITRTTPKINEAAMQFVKTGPAGLYKSATEQLKKAEAVKAMRQHLIDEEEDWQANLDKWKSSRRKRNEDALVRAIEIKKNEQEEELIRMRRKSKTYSEMQVDKNKRGRRYNLVVHSDDNNDLSGLGLSSAKSTSSLNDPQEENDVKDLDQDNKDAKSDAGFCTGSDTGSDGVFAEDNISDTSSALGDKKEAHDSLLDPGVSKEEEAHLNGHGSSLITDGFHSSAATIHTDEYTYDKAIAGYKQYAENSAKKRTNSITSLNSNTSYTKDDERKDEVPRVNGRSPSPNKSNKVEEKLNFFSKEMEKDFRTSPEPRVTLREKSPKVDIGKRRSMFEMRDPSPLRSEREQRIANRKSLEMSSSLRHKVASFENLETETPKVRGVTPTRDTNLRNKVASFENLETETPKVRGVTPTRDTNLRNKVASFENLETETTKVRGVTPTRDTNLRSKVASFENLDIESTKVRSMTPTRDTKFYEKLATFATKDYETQPIRKKTPERDANFHKKLASFTSIENGEEDKMWEHRTIPQRDPTLKNKIASYEQLEQLVDPRTSNPLEDMLRSKDRSVSLEHLNEPQVKEVKIRPARSMMNITRRVPSTPYMVVDLEGSRVEEKCVKQTKSMVSDEPDSSNARDPAKRSTIYETVEKCQVIRDVESAPLYSIFKYLSPEVNAQVFEIASKLEETPLLGSPTHKAPTDPLPPSPTLEADSLEGAKLYTDDDINEVGGDHSESKDTVDEHHYQTLEEVREEVKVKVEQGKLTPSPAMMTSVSPSLLDTPEVLDVTWTDGPSQAAPPSEPPPPPPPDDDSDIDASDEPQSLPTEEEDCFTRENSTRRLKKELWRRRSDFLGTSSQYIEEESTVRPPPDLSDLLRQEREAERSLVSRNSIHEILNEADIARREREIIESLERSEQEKHQQHDQYIWDDGSKENGTTRDKNEIDEHMQYQECLNVDRNSCSQELPSLPPPPPSPVSNVTRPFAYLAANLPTPSDFIPMSPLPEGDEISNRVSQHNACAHGRGVCSSPPPLPLAPTECSVPSLTPIPECEENNLSSPLFSMAEISSTPEIITPHPSSPQVMMIGIAESPEVITKSDSQLDTSEFILSSTPPIDCTALCTTTEKVNVKLNSQKDTLISHSQIKDDVHSSETASLTQVDLSQTLVQSSSTDCNLNLVDPLYFESCTKILSTSASLANSQNSVSISQSSTETSSFNTQTSIVNSTSNLDLMTLASQSPNSVTVASSEASEATPQTVANLSSSVTQEQTQSVMFTHDSESTDLAPKQLSVPYVEAPLPSASSNIETNTSDISVEHVSSNSISNLNVKDISSPVSVTEYSELDNTGTNSSVLCVTRACSDGSQHTSNEEQGICSIQESQKKNCHEKTVRFCIDESLCDSQTNFEVNDSDTGVLDPPSEDRHTSITVSHDLVNSAQNHLKPLSSFTRTSNLFPSQAKNLQTSYESDREPKVYTRVPVASTNVLQSSHSVSKTTDSEHWQMNYDSFDSSCTVLKSAINTEKTHEVFESHVGKTETIVEAPPQLPFRTDNQTSVESECQLPSEPGQQYPDPLVAHSGTLDYNDDTLASTNSHPEEYKKLAELEEEMMRHDKDMLRRTGQLAAGPAAALESQTSHIPPLISYASHEERQLSPLHQLPPSIENGSYNFQQQASSHFPIQEFYTAPTYESVSPASMVQSEGLSTFRPQGQKTATLPARSPSQYNTLASPHPFSRSNSQSCLDAPKHSPLQMMRSMPVASPRESIPEPLPRRKKAPPPTPNKSLKTTSDINTAERMEAIRVSRMPTSVLNEQVTGNEQVIVNEQVETHGPSVSPSGQQMSKQTLLALSAIPKPRLTDNESWITKKKTDAQKRDYSKHWLHQEAEQRRLEQQDQISRQKLPATQPQPKPSQNVSPQQTSQHSPPTQTSYHPTQTAPSYPLQNSTSPYSSYPQALKNPSPSHSCNNNNSSSSSISSSSSWRNQATTYQPHMPSPAPNGDKALPDSIIHNLTQRVNNKNSKNTYTNASGRLGNNYNNNSYRDENYHDYMNADAVSASHTHAPLYQSGMGPGQPSPPTSQQQDANSAQDQRLLSVSGKKKCSHCSEELGRGAAMIIESLRLFYHIPCFKCCVCGIQLGNGSAGADVRVRNHKLHCHNCYSNDEGMKFSKV